VMSRLMKKRNLTALYNIPDENVSTQGAARR
jgi:hypothetical protein